MLVCVCVIVCVKHIFFKYCNVIWFLSFFISVISDTSNLFAELFENPCYLLK